jgi:hypothetical protein
MRGTDVVLVMAATVLLGLSAPSSALECGDVDANGNVTALDALVVLRRAVGLPQQPLLCPDQCANPTTTTSTTSNSSGDQCFTDQDCMDIFGPGFICGGSNASTCVQCRNEDQCESGFVCTDYECVPSNQVIHRIRTITVH